MIPGRYSLPAVNSACLRPFSFCPGRCCFSSIPSNSALPLTCSSDSASPRFGCLRPISGYDRASKAAALIHRPRCAAEEKTGTGTGNAATCFCNCALSRQHWMVGNCPGGGCQGLPGVPRRLRRRFSALDARVSAPAPAYRLPGGTLCLVWPLTTVCASRLRLSLSVWPLFAIDVLPRLAVNHDILSGS